MEAAKRMGGSVTEADASAITEEASITRKHLSADNMARFLGVTYAQRQALHLTTIGSVDVKKRARKVLRQRKDRLYRERKRRASGVLARTEYEANSVAAKARAGGVSRMDDLPPPQASRRTSQEQPQCYRCVGSYLLI
jgi:hypothetical protein